MKTLKTTEANVRARVILMERYVSLIAAMKQDGEDDFDMTNDDAVETLNNLIAAARELLNA